MDVVLTALAMLGVLFVIFSEGSSRMRPIRARRADFIAQTRSLARSLRLQPDVEHPRQRFHGTHTLGHVMRSVALEPHRNLQLVLEVGLRRPTPIALRARRARHSEQLEVLSARVLASETLLGARVEALLARELARHGDVEIERDLVRLVLRTPPHDVEAARALLRALAELAELIEMLASELQDTAHPARRLGFLPTPRRATPTRSVPLPGAELVMSDAAVSLHPRNAAPVFISLERPFRVLFSRSHDVAGCNLLHVELRQRDEDGAWHRLALSSRTATFAAPIDALAVKAYRAPFLPEEAMLELLARLRAASAVLGTPLEQGGLEA